MTEIDYLMTPKEVAKYMGVSKMTVSKYLNKETNPIPAIRISPGLVRIRKVLLDEWLSNFMK